MKTLQQENDHFKEELTEVADFEFSLSPSEFKSPLKKKGLWKKIAKNEIKIRTSKMRKNRPVFFIALFGFLMIWAFSLCPFLFNLFMPSLAAEAGDIFVPIVAMIIEYVMMIFFMVILLYPLNVVYRKAEIGFKEILISSPASAGDIFLGEYIGKFPIYSGLILIIGPALTGLMSGLINFSLIQYAVIYGALFGMVVFSTLVGSIIASWLEHKISKSEKARDLGKVLIMALSIGMVSVMYTMQYLFQFFISNPELKNWFMLYPSLWYSNIILYALNPALLDAYVLNIWTSLLLAISLPTVLIYFVLKKAESFYTLEGGIEKTSSLITKESSFYKLMRKTSGKKWGGLVTVQMKVFFRRKENITKLVYVAGLTSFLAFIITFTQGEGNPIFVDVMSAFIIMMVGMMFALMLGHYIFVESKDLLWLYKRSPRNVNALVYSYLICYTLINLMLVVPITIIHSLIWQFNVLEALFHFALMFTFTLLSVLEAIGIQCINPAFEEKGKNMSGNVFFNVGLQVGGIVLLIVMMIMFDVFETTNPSDAKIVMIIPLMMFHAIAAVPIFYFGLRKLNRME